MRIEKVEIDVFGSLKDRKYGPLSSGLTVFLGNNETGKSTVLAFVRTLFFGFPNRRRSKSGYEPLDPGVFGGRLTLILDDGQRLVVERKRSFDGVKSQRPIFRLYDESGQLLPESFLQDLFGSITSSLYENVFGFGLDELQYLESLSGTEIKDAIYGAGFGAALLAVPSARKKIEKELSRLFKPSGQNQEINRLLAELDVTKSKVVAAKGQLEEYGRCVRIIKETEGAIKDLESGLRSVGKRFQRLKQIVSCWDEYIELVQLKRQIESLKKRLGQVIPSNKELWRAKALASDISDASKLLKKKETECSRLLNQLEEISPNDNFLKRSKQIQLLLSKRHHFSHLEQEILKKKQELEDLNGAIHDCFAILGPDWTEDMVKEIDTGTRIRASVQAYKRSFDRISTDLVLLDKEGSVREQDLKRLESEQERLSKDAEALRDLLGQVDKEGLDRVIKELARAEIILKELSEIEQEEVILRDRISSMCTRLGIDMPFERLVCFDFEGLLKNARVLFDDFVEKEQRYKFLHQRSNQEKEELLRLQKRLELKRDQIKGLEQKLSLPDSDIVELYALASSLSGSISQRPQLGASIASLELEEKRLDKMIMAQDRLLSLWVRIERVGTLLWPVGAGFILLPFWPDSPYQDWLLIIAGVCTVLCASVVKKWCKSKREAYLVQKHDLEEGRRSLNSQKEGLITELKRIEKGLEKVCTLTGLKREALLADFSRVVNRVQNDLSLLEEKRSILNEIERLEDIVFEKEETIKALEDEIAKLRDLIQKIKEQWKRLAKGLDLQLDLDATEGHGLLKGLESLWLNITELLEFNKKKVYKKEALENIINELYKFLGLRYHNVSKDSDGSSFDQSILNIKERLGELVNSLNGLGQLEESLRRNDYEKTRLLSTLTDIHSQREKLLSKRRHVSKDWTCFLQALGMPCSYEDAPETVLEILLTVDRLKQLLLKRQRLKRVLEDFGRQVHNAKKEVEGILQEFSPDFEFDFLVQAVDYLVEFFEKETKKLENRRQIQKVIGHLESENRELRNRIKELQDRLNRLFEGSSVSSIEELEEQLDVALELERKEARLNELLLTISSKFLIEPRYGKVVAIFSKRSLHDIEADIKELERQEEELLKERDRLYKERAEAVQILKGLVSSTEHQEFLAKYEMLRANLKELTLKWSVLSLAKTLLERATKRFEQENQPKVLSEASEHFSMITKGRYHNILPDQREGFVVVSNQGQRYGPARLSRGTAEQLYLCLRFGVISVCEPKNETIPVLMDDIFVNFDPERMELAAKAVVHLAQKRQVIFFTCHPHVASVLISAAGQAKLVRM